MAAADANLSVAIFAAVSALLGPLAAVLVTLYWERTRRSREERQTILQTLLATRGHPADPSYSWAIRTTPLHFSSSKGVLAAHASYMDAVRFKPATDQQERHVEEMGRRQGILISEMLKDLGYRGLTSEQVEAYTAQGWVDREEVTLRAMEALPQIAVSAKRSADSADELLSRMPEKG